MPESEPIIAIIGNGCASAECIKALRENGHAGEIHMITDSKWPMYTPLLTTYYVDGKIRFEQLFPYGQNDSFYHDYGVDIHSGSPVASLDAEAKTIINQVGFDFKYDKCLIASGASPILPVIKGGEAERIYVMRTVDDAIRLKNAVSKKPHKALVVGASMVGMKVAEVLVRAGVKIWVADLADRIFPQNAHPDCSHIIENRLRQKGINFKFNSTVKETKTGPDNIKVYFDNNENDEFDFLVFCIGVRPNISFINPKQISVKQGVLVDEHMSTNVPDVYAAGDVAQGKNMLTNDQQTIGLFTNARYQGRTAGKNMAGISDTYQGNIPHNIAHFFGMDFVSIGDVCNYDRVEQKRDSAKFLQFFWRHGLFTGANLLDSYTEAGLIKSLLIKRLIQSALTHAQPSLTIPDLLIRQAFSEVKIL